MTLPAKTKPSNLATETSIEKQSAIRYCETEAGLADIKRSDTQLVIWRRSRPPAFREKIQGIFLHDQLSIRILVAPDDAAAALSSSLDTLKFEAGPLRDTLLADVTVLARRYSEIAECKLVDIRLEHIKGDACWRFHRDNVECRLITTYIGASTEWVTLENSEQALVEQRNYSGRIERLENHDVAIFKGNSLDPECGIVHRSPPIEGTGQSRLMLCINQESIVSPKAWRKNEHKKV